MSSGTILMTGGTGFLGSHLLARLREEEMKVVLLKRSSSNTSRIQRQLASIQTYDVDQTDLARVFSEHKIDCVLHCATHYGRQELDPIGVIEANLILPLKLLKLATDHGTRCFINTDTVLDKRINHYSLSKKQFLDWMQAYGSKITAVNVALEHFYGPHDDPSKFVSYIIREIIGGAPRIDLTEGRQKRDFIHVDDVVEAFLAILRASMGAQRNDGEVIRYEVGTQNNITIREFVERAKKLAGNTTTELRFGALPYRPNEVMESNADTTRLRSLGWEPKVDLDEGLRRTIEHERTRLSSCAS